MFLESTNQQKSGIIQKWLGKVPYAVALEFQSELVVQALETQEAFLLGLEHPKVVTLGKRGDLDQDLKLSVQDLESLNFQYYRVDRGGHATLHSPGQLVIYPIVPLERFNISIRDFVCKMQKATQELLQIYGIETFQEERDPGLYTKNGKIAFFGIRIQKGITYHGLSLNVSNNLEDFDMIRSCGKDVETFDRVSFYNPNASSHELFEKWCEIFRKII